MTVLINASNTSGLTFSSDTSGSIAFQSNGSNVATIQPAGFSYSGAVVQVVNAAYGNIAATTSTSLSDTGLSASITPKFATSKILIFTNVNGCYKQGDTALQLVLLRNSTQILLIDDLISYTGSAALNAVGSSSSTYLDSPATTSATTYKVQFCTKVSGQSVTVQNYFSAVGNTKSTMTLMEIAV